MTEVDDHRYMFHIHQALTFPMYKWVFRTHFCEIAKIPLYFPDSSKALPSKHYWNLHLCHYITNWLHIKAMVSNQFKSE